MEVFNNDVVLFDRDEGDERQTVLCRMLQDGALVVECITAGEVTRAAFGRDAHRESLQVAKAGAQRLAEYFHVEEPSMLLGVLRLEFTGEDSFVRMRGLFDRLGIAYDAVEAASDER